MLKINSIITVIGGTGFLGSYVVKALADTGLRINVISRCASRANYLKMFGAVGQISLIDGNVKDYPLLEKYIRNSDYVINLIGILYPSGNQDFKTLHTEVPKTIASLCNIHKIKKLIHVSALGIDRALTSKYAKSKLAGENEIRENFPRATIFRPSVMFGPEDNFINAFNTIFKFSPVMPLIGGGHTKFQPIFVDDVARAIRQTLNDENGIYEGNTYELGGPEILTLKDIMVCILKTTNRRRWLLPIPFTLAKIKALFLELFPRPPLTRDQVELLRYDNMVAGKNGLDIMGIKGEPLETVIAKYI